MESFAVVRADSATKVNTALLDLRRYGRMVFSDVPKYITSDYADEILTEVLCTQLRNKCRSAAVVPLKTIPSVAIGNLSRIHPPAHIIIISPKYDIFEELKSDIASFPRFEVRKSMPPEESEQTVYEAIA
ncbi:MAG: DUF356 domain-containing protein [Methanosarcinales archaeon]|nr:DUF356 domain-containing protein [ANME-2 cluster archaeon]MDF1530812.1 DUF356 domain-containing protein [ANME-2 cluster archaeon]MDW7776469.1 DUF356 domain-containing protein [Methanosarcinales archaeon]